MGVHLIIAQDKKSIGIFKIILLLKRALPAIPSVSGTTC